MRSAPLLFLTGMLCCEAATAQDCTVLTERLQKLDFAAASPVRNEAGTPFTDLYGECDLKNTFGGNALPTFKGKPLRCSSDPNRVKRLVQFPDGTLVFNAKASVDGDGSAASCGPNKSSTDQCQTWLTFDAGSSRKYVDAEQVPFIVLPVAAPGSGGSLMRSTRASKGDLAIAFHAGRCTLGVVGDAGPYFRLGEISIAAHADLGNPQCASDKKPCPKLVNGGSGRGLSSDVTYVVFPGTRPKPLVAESIVQVSKEAAAARFNEFSARYSKH